MLPAATATNTADAQVRPPSDYPHAAALTHVLVAPVSRGTASAPSASPDVAPLARAHVRFSSQEVLASNAPVFISAPTRAANDSPLGRLPPFPSQLVHPQQPLRPCGDVSPEETANATTRAREGKESASSSVGARAPELLCGGTEGPGDHEAEKEDEEDEEDEEEEGLFCERLVVIRGSEQAVEAAERTLRRIVGRQPIRTRETMTVPQV